MSARAALVVALATAGLAIALGSPAAQAHFPSCDEAYARAVIRSSSLPARVKDLTGRGGGVRTLLCNDLTGDGRVDLTVSLSGGGKAGATAWIVFRGTSEGWAPALRRLDVENVRIRASGRDLIETQPVYGDRDPKCCPSGGYAHRRYHWQGDRFVVSERWRTRRP